ncbi:class I SAM-dependent methyltransferase [Thioalbus denitrificans]|uniref:Methyltransferase family protein n=1 Tax=Thioalbus denitrificans TaxID=547122 RepID=A0A369CHQ8_9GAMM|nr:class I SAM-dependent methyltransferase [Thioalbus denitrificans]RCX33459.1 methyltransferase family protein [Thioalbus denitrificans]
MNRINYKKALLALAYRLAWPRNHKCILCAHSFFRYLPYRKGSLHSAPLMRALDVVGSDTDRFSCPWCGCHDRERHLYMYMNASGIFDAITNRSVLHFAPERRLSERIVSAGPEKYIKCDFMPQAIDVMPVDILDIPFNDCSFDILIANHVMEHVADDARALTEIYRVLKPGGYAILQTPYSSKLQKTWSDPGIDTDECRYQAYGQEDHVRLYGLDIFERYKLSGLSSCVKWHDELLGDFDGWSYGVNENEPFFLFMRKQMEFDR